MEDTLYMSKIIILLIIAFLSLLTGGIAAVQTPVDQIQIDNQLGNTTTYSLVHLSDTQNLATHYPDTYDLTFSYLESIREKYNISAIILTGDLVNSWKKKPEWSAYFSASHKTSIPLYTIAGNHDTSSGTHPENYRAFTGNMLNTYITPLNDFTLVGINYVKSSLSKKELINIRETLRNASHPFTIIATHNYMYRNGSPSLLGTDINRELIIHPTLILTGHWFANFINVTTIESHPVILDMTNYQNGVKGGSTKANYSAGILYTITARDGLVEKITAQSMGIYPEKFFRDEKTVYERQK